MQAVVEGLVGCGQVMAHHPHRGGGAGRGGRVIKTMLFRSAHPSVDDSASDAVCATPGSSLAFNTTRPRA